MIKLTSLLNHCLILCRTCYEEAQQVPGIEAETVTMSCAAICIRLIHDTVLDDKNIITGNQNVAARQFCRDLSEFHFASCQHTLDCMID